MIRNSLRRKIAVVLSRTPARIALAAVALGSVAMVWGLGLRGSEDAVYVCPMHPEVTSDKKGDRCTECNMFLVPESEIKEKGHEGHDHEAAKGKAPAGSALYHCPMHPTYTSDRQGECPICGMDLVPVTESEDEASAVPGQATVKIDPTRQQLIGMKVEELKKRHLTKIIRTSGRVAYDPELFATQEEYLSARRSFKKIGKSPDLEMGKRADSLVSSSRLRLKLLGLSDTQIGVLDRRGRPDANLLMGDGKSEDGTAWLYADIYEHEFGLVGAGQQVVATTLAYPGHKFTGKVIAVDSLVDPSTRSIKLRARISNRRGLLKPDMFMNVRISVDLGTQLALPAEAVLFTGARRMVFLDRGEGRFEPREIELGMKSEEFYQVVSGLKEGDRVVVSGNFLVDSESKLRSVISQMAGHKH